MNSSGIVLAVAGVWVLCQVLGGRALERLGIVGSGWADWSLPSANKVATSAVAPVGKALTPVADALDIHGNLHNQILEQAAQAYDRAGQHDIAAQLRAKKN